MDLTNENMVTITVKIDDSCEMASVFDSNGEGMEGNFWDFHNGCHGMNHLNEFNDVEEFISALRVFNEDNGIEVNIVRETYDYENEN